MFVSEEHVDERPNLRDDVPGTARQEPSSKRF